MLQEEPMRYQCITRVGNWYERNELEETNMKDYLKRQEDKKLYSDKWENVMRKNYEPIPLSGSDESVRFGDQIMLQNLSNQGYLVNDVQDRINSVFTEAYSVSTKTDIGACRRSVFTIESYENSCKVGDSVKYGDKILIVANQMLTNQNRMYINTGPLQYNRQSKVSKKQEVLIVNKSTFENVWTFEHSDAKQRFRVQGQIVRPGEEVLIKNIHTQQWLASANFTMINTFGKEYEVFCHSYQTLNKTQNLISEKEGRTTSDVSLRNQTNENSWMVIKSIDDTQQVQSFVKRYSKDQTTLQDIINNLRFNIMNKKSLFAFRNLHLDLVKAGQSNKGCLDEDQLRKVLLLNSIQLQRSELEQVYQGLRESQKGLINVITIVNAIRGELSSIRSSLIDQAYDKLYKEGSGTVVLQQIAKNYNPSKDPMVLNNSLTESEVFKLFMKYWTSQDSKSEISRDEFKDYYHDIGACMPRDDHFEYLIKTAWGIYQ